MNPRFKIKVIKYNWSCGDGCCSDSGYKLEAYELDEDGWVTKCLYENDEWKYNSYWGTLFNNALKEISKIKENPIENVDYFIQQVIQEDGKDSQTGEYELIEYDANLDYGKER